MEVFSYHEGNLLYYIHAVQTKLQKNVWVYTVAAFVMHNNL